MDGCNAFVWFFFLFFFQKMSEGCRCFLSCDLDRFSRTLLADALAILELSISLVSGLSSGGGSQALMTRAFKRSRQSAVLSCWYRVFSEVTMSCPSLFIMCWQVSSSFFLPRGGIH
uniref:Putative secreted protein n=1 Tax=Ixodes ricinus TaxID=34613 RepID=A0A6B0UL21_IXORI